MVTAHPPWREHPARLPTGPQPSIITLTMTAIYTGPTSLDAAAYAQPLWLYAAPDSAENIPRHTPQRATRQIGLLKRQAIDLFGLVTLLVEPRADDRVLFENGVSAEILPPEYLPAIVEGIWNIAYNHHPPNDTAPPIIIVGFTVTVVHAVYHAVDSRPIAFRMAAMIGLRACFDAARLDVWRGVPAAAAGALPTVPLPERVAAQHAQFASAAEQIESTLISHVLQEEGFTQIAPQLYSRAVGPLHHIVQVRPVWHAVLQIHVSVRVPQIAALLTDKTGLVEQLTHFYAQAAWRRLALTPSGPEGGLLIDVGADVDGLAADVVRLMREDGLPFFEPWVSAETLLTAGQTDQLKLGRLRIAALHTIIAQPDTALALIDAELATLKQPYANHIEHAWRTLRKNVVTP